MQWTPKGMWMFGSFSTTQIYKLENNQMVNWWCGLALHQCDFNFKSCLVATYTLNCSFEYQNCMRKFHPRESSNGISELGWGQYFFRKPSSYLKTMKLWCPPSHIKLQKNSVARKMFPKKAQENSEWAGIKWRPRSLSLDLQRAPRRVLWNWFSMWIWYALQISIYSCNKEPRQ
jgi:hypothetical protein